jgi:hydrogenobyrinic acid a,c-diamide synthase (glutamine-hydrolysing) (EC 6.3.5.9)/cobyrinate a,c-diamide synthase (EC 6.3.5.-)
LTLTADVGVVSRGHNFHDIRKQGIDSDAQFALTIGRGDGTNGTHDGVVEYQTLVAHCHRHPGSGAFDILSERVTSRGYRAKSHISNIDTMISL